MTDGKIMFPFPILTLNQLTGEDAVRWEYLEQ